MVSCLAKSHNGAYIASGDHLHHNEYHDHDQITTIAMEQRFRRFWVGGKLCLCLVGNLSQACAQVTLPIQCLWEVPEVSGTRCIRYQKYQVPKVSGTRNVSVQKEKQRIVLKILKWHLLRLSSPHGAAGVEAVQFTAADRCNPHQDLLDGTTSKNIPSHTTTMHSKAMSERGRKCPWGGYLKKKQFLRNWLLVHIFVFMLSIVNY